ncbi:MAG TPA: DUF294 nucleotidyltransferase-like domain-containing protein [Rubricoccaceae bacterium]|jgi:CBS domain-containing protein
MASLLFAPVAALFDRTEPFRSLPAAERAALMQKMTVEFYAPGEVVLQQGEDIHRALYVVTEGVVRLSDAETGRTIDMCGAGASFGAYGLLQGGALPYEARAVEEGTACALVAAETFNAIRASNEAFQSYFDAEVKRFVRLGADDVDAAGAFLLFDTELGRVLRDQTASVEATATAREAAQAMAASDADAVVVLQGGAAIGVVTEGDLVERIVAAGLGAETPVMALVDRPPIALRSDERLFDAIRTMMRYRVRRLVIVDAQTGALRGLLTSDDVSHFRGLDPVATTERLERVDSVAELAALRQDSNRRLYRLHYQGVDAEDLLDIVTEVDDQLKHRLISLVETELRAEATAAGETLPPLDAWAWLTFGPAGRRESVLRAFQDNGIVYADPDPADADAVASYYERLGTRVVEGLRTCGYASSENGLSAAIPAFRQPLSAWKTAYARWTTAADPDASAAAGLAFDLRAIYGDDVLAEALRETVREHLPSRPLTAVLAREAARTPVPLGSFNRFEIDEIDVAGTRIAGVDVRMRAVAPTVRMARALALDAGFLGSANTFERLRAVGASPHPLAETARALLPALTTLVDLHLRHQMMAAEIGAPLTDLVDPEHSNRSQQNLLREALQTVRKAQEAVREYFGA